MFLVATEGGRVGVPCAPLINGAPGKDAREMLHGATPERCLAAVCSEALLG